MSLEADSPASFFASGGPAFLPRSLPIISGRRRGSDSENPAFQPRYRSMLKALMNLWLKSVYTLLITIVSHNPKSFRTCNVFRKEEVLFASLHLSHRSLSLGKKLATRGQRFTEQYCASWCAPGCSRYSAHRAGDIVLAFTPGCAPAEPSSTSKRSQAALGCRCRSCYSQLFFVLLLLQPDESDSVSDGRDCCFLYCW